MSIETMPLEEMKHYRGTNPKPADFDSFWDESLTLLKKHSSMPELIPAAVQFPSVQCFDLFFRGQDGARVHAKLLKPRQYKGKLPVVFLFHGYTGDSGDWWEKLSWIQQGFAVAALDCRGQSGLSDDVSRVSGLTCTGQFIRGVLDAPEKLLFRQIFMDIVLLADIIKSMPETDTERLVAHGGSQGGALSLICAALVPEIKRAAVLYPFLSDYKRVCDLDCRGSAYSELWNLFRAKDPRHEHETEIFTNLGYIDVQNFTPRIHAEILWGTGLKDEACPASTQFAVYNKLACPKKMVLYPDHGHENLPGFVDECFGFLNPTPSFV